MPVPGLSSAVIHTFRFPAGEPDIRAQSKVIGFVLFAKSHTMSDEFVLLPVSTVFIKRLSNDVVATVNVLDTRQVPLVLRLVTFIPALTALPVVNEFAINKPLMPFPEFAVNGISKTRASPLSVDIVAFADKIVIGVDNFSL